MGKDFLMGQLGNKLKLNNSSWAVFSIINSAKMHERRIIAWRLIGPQKVCSDISFRIIRKFRNEIVISPLNEASKQKLASMVIGSKILNFYIPDDMVLFQSRVVRQDSNGDITVSFPDQIAQIDRRNHLRLFIENQNIMANFSKKSKKGRRGTQAFEKRCYDLSAGGMSFVVSKIESAFFEEGDYLFGVDLRVDGHIHVMNAQVVNIQSVQPNDSNKLNYKGYKICLKFLEVPQAVRKKIDDYVFSEIELSENII